MRHGSVKRPTMFLASMDTRTPFDVARPKHIAKIMEDHTVHGWIIAALLREMAGLEGLAAFECVHSLLPVAFAKGASKPPLSPPFTQTVAEHGHADPGKCGTGMGKEEGGRHFKSGGTRNSPDMQF